MTTSELQRRTGVHARALGPAETVRGARPLGEVVPGYGLFEGDPPAGDGGALPVFRAGEGGGDVVVTGRLFVRFRGEATDQAAELAEAGYDIDQIPAWAPQAAWVKARAGEPADALTAGSRLAQLPGVVNAEPELLRPRAQR